MSYPYSHVTRANGTILTASIYNTDHQNHIDNNIPSTIDDASASVGAMQTTTTPGTVGAESLATTLEGEIQRLRYAIKEIKGSAQWYGVPTSSALFPLASTPVVVGVNFIIDGVGVEIPDGVAGFIEIPFACTITRASLLADQTGSIVLDLWKDTYANYQPTVADTITAAAKPTIASGLKAQDTTLTGWTTSLAAGDILAVKVDSCTTITRCTLSLLVTKS